MLISPHDVIPISLELKLNDPSPNCVLCPLLTIKGASINNSSLITTLFNDVSLVTSNVLSNVVAPDTLSVSPNTAFLSTFNCSVIVTLLLNVVLLYIFKLLFILLLSPISIFPLKLESLFTIKLFVISTFCSKLASCVTFSSFII